MMLWWLIGLFPYSTVGRCGRPSSLSIIPISSSYNMPYWVEAAHDITNRHVASSNSRFPPFLAHLFSFDSLHFSIKTTKINLLFFGFWLFFRSFAAWNWSLIWFSLNAIQEGWPGGCLSLWNDRTTGWGWLPEFTCIAIWTSSYHKIYIGEAWIKLCPRSVVG